jgi:hypothetical protein
VVPDQVPVQDEGLEWVVMKLSSENESVSARPSDAVPAKTDAKRVAPGSPAWPPDMACGLTSL